MISKKLRLLCLFFVLCIAVSCFSMSVCADDNSDKLNGKGTLDSPYTVGSPEELVIFREMVNSGNSFKDKYVLQTCDIDLGLSDLTRLWIPIGAANEKDCFFYGTYNGGGHVIRNLCTDTSVAGLFSFLGGTVMNLGIESGNVKGDYVGAIASHSAGGFAQIINCYSTADVSGIRAGGLADNFYGGSIVDSWCAANVNGSDTAGGIVSYGVNIIIDTLSVGETPALQENNAITQNGVASLSTNEADISALKEQFRQRSHNNISPLSQKLQITEGDGTKKSPFIVSNATQLKRIGFWVNANNGTNFYGNHFLQQSDINLLEIDTWTPIGTPESPFCGIYDGGGHSIKNIKVYTSENDAAALFGYICGSILNLSIESGRIEGGHAAGIVGFSTGSASAIANCRNNAEIVGIHSAAGIANSLEHGIIVSCLNTGKISAGDYHAGICVQKVGKMYNCFSVGSPVSHESTEGIIKASCRQVSNAEEAATMLNNKLYNSSTRLNFQKNNLVKWNSDGTLSDEYHNYFAMFLTREIFIAAILFVCIFCAYIIYKTSLTKSKLGISELKTTAVSEYRNFNSCHNNRIQGLLCIGFIFAFGMLTVGYINGDNTISKAFSWTDQNDAFMDFFNPLHSVLNSNYFEEGHYTNPRSIYPPVVKALLWIFGQILPTDISSMSAKDIKASSAGLLLVSVIFMLCLILLLHLFNKASDKRSRFLAVCSLFSSPMLFLIDRGNVLIFALVLSALFIIGYRSENTLIRHLSYICLGLAAAIKIYPVVLGLLVLREKKLKHSIQCIAYGAAICLVPFFIIGLDELGLYIKNVFFFIDKNSVGTREWLLDYSHVLSNASYILFKNGDLGKELAKYTLYPLTFLLATCAIITQKQRNAVLAVMLIQILFPGTSVYYCATLLIIPFMLFIGCKDKRKIDYIYAFLYFLALVPLQFLCGAFEFQQFSIWNVSGVCGVLLATLLLADCTVEIIRRIKKHRSAVLQTI